MVKHRRLYGAYAVFLLLILISVLLRHHNFAVFNSAGVISGKERNLMIFASVLSLVVVLPVFALTIFIVWKYRANKKSTYTPDWDHSRVAETIWWVVPALLIMVLAVVTWNSSHDLDPYKPIASDKPAINVQVIALDWKWLFIYPKQHIASVNMMEFPRDTPVNLQITSDAPMNSLWIPQLSGQVYAMSGMSTQLHIMANKMGDYRGVSANISGKGFSGMHFIARSTDDTDFTNWVRDIQQNGNELSNAQYKILAQPSQNNAVAYYSPVAPDLYGTILLKYMGPQNSNDMSAMTNMSDMAGMSDTSSKGSIR